MKRQDFAKFVHKAQRKISKYTPEILTGVGIAGMVAAGVMAVKETPKALQNIEEKKEELGTNKLTVVDTVKSTWKCYAPAVLTGTLAAGCLIGATSVNTRRTAALATAYKLSETAFKEYKDAVIETIGEKKEETVKQKVAENRVKNTPIEQIQIVNTGKGNTLCLDPWSKRPFLSDIEVIKKAVTKLNRDMTYDMSGYVSLNDFYNEIGLEGTEAGKILGWNIADGLFEVCLDAVLYNETDPCVVVDFSIPPVHGFKKGY